MTAEKSDTIQATPQTATEALVPSAANVREVAGETFIATSMLANEFGYDADHIGRLARQGKVKSVREGKRWFISRVSLEDYQHETDLQKKTRALESIRVSHEASRKGSLRKPLVVPSLALFHIAERIRASRINLGASPQGGSLRFILLALFLFGIISVPMPSVPETRMTTLEIPSEISESFRVSLEKTRASVTNPVESFLRTPPLSQSTAIQLVPAKPPSQKSDLLTDLQSFNNRILTPYRKIIRNLVTTIDSQLYENSHTLLSTKLIRIAYHKSPSAIAITLPDWGDPLDLSTLGSYTRERVHAATHFALVRPVEINSHVEHFAQQPIQKKYTLADIQRLNDRILQPYKNSIRRLTSLIDTQLNENTNTLLATKLIHIKDSPVVTSSPIALPLWESSISLSSLSGFVRQSIYTATHFAFDAQPLAARPLVHVPKKPVKKADVTTDIQESIELHDLLADIQNVNGRILKPLHGLLANLVFGIDDQLRKSTDSLLSPPITISFKSRGPIATIKDQTTLGSLDLPSWQVLISVSSLRTHLSEGVRSAMHFSFESRPNLIAHHENTVRETKSWSFQNPIERILEAGVQFLTAEIESIADFTLFAYKDFHQPRTNAAIPSSKTAAIFHVLPRGATISRPSPIVIPKPINQAAISIPFLKKSTFTPAPNPRNTSPLAPSGSDLANIRQIVSSVLNERGIIASRPQTGSPTLAAFNDLVNDFKGIKEKVNRNVFEQLGYSPSQGTTTIINYTTPTTTGTSGTTDFQGESVTVTGTVTSADITATDTVSAVTFTGGGLADCIGSNFLQYSGSTSQFGCAAGGSGPGGSGVELERSGTQVLAASTILNLDDGAFNLTASGSTETIIRLDWINGPASRSADQTVTGFWTFTGGASFSTDLEVTGYASASAFFGAGLTDCDAGTGNKALNWSSETGKFSCTDDDAGGGGGALIEVRESSAVSGTHVSSVSFDAGHFNVTFSGTEAIIKTDWTNGPASRSATQTITGFWTFPNFSSTATFESTAVKTTTLSSDGVITIGAPVSVSGNFELTNSGARLGINAGGSTNTNFEVGGTASISSTLTLAGGIISSHTASNTFSGSLDPSKGVHAGGNITTTALFIGTSAGSNSFSGSLDVLKGIRGLDITATGRLTAAGAIALNGAVTSALTFTNTGLATFNGGVSVSTNFELVNNTRLGINAGGSTNTNFEVGGTASISSTLTLAGGIISSHTASNTFSGSLDPSKGVHAGGNITTTALFIGTSAGSNSFSGSLDVLKGIRGLDITANGRLVTVGHTLLATATTSSNFEARGYASASAFILPSTAGTTLGDCDDESQTLNWDATSRKFVCLADGVGGGGISSNSLNFDEFQDALVLDADTTITGGARSLTFDHASVSGTFEITGDIQFFGEIRPDGATCLDGQILKKTGANNWDCADDETSAGAGVSTIQLSDSTIEGAATTIDFTGAHFVVTSAPAGEANIRLSWDTGGPASLSQDELVSGKWTFGNNVSISSGNNLEVTGYASASQFFGAGLTDCDAADERLQWTASGSNQGYFKCITAGSTLEVTWGNINVLANHPAPTTYTLPNTTGYELGLYRLTNATTINVVSSALDRFRSNVGGYVNLCEVRWNAAITAGRFELSIYVNDVLIRDSCAMDSSANASRSFQELFGPTAITFSAGDRIVVVASTNATFAPTTNDVLARLNLVFNGADLAEYYYTHDEDLSAGMIAQLDSSLFAGIKRAGNAQAVLGIISDGAGLTLGSKEGPGRPLLVALSGRVPVLVKGKVKAGDYITMSDELGIGKSAEKSGYVIGQAIEDKEGEDIDSVMIFVNNSYFGGRFSQFISSSEGSLSDFGQQLLTQLVASQSFNAVSGSLSELFVDRLAAGLEIITPSILTQTIQTEEIRSENLKIGLSENGKLILGSNLASNSLEGPIVLDSLGNAFFAGQLNAADISIPGFASIRTSLSEIASISEIFKGRLSEVELKLENAQTFTEGLTVDGLTILNGGLKVNSIGSLSGLIELQNDVLFFGRPYFNVDTAGFAVVPEGKREVQIIFDDEYLDEPVVHVAQSLGDEADASVETQTFIEGVRYLISRKNTKGFTIILEKSALRDMRFNWIALAVKNPKTFRPTPEPTPEILPTPEIVIEITSTPIPPETISDELIPMSESSPDESPVPTPKLPEPTPNPSPDITSTPTSEPSSSLEAIPTDEPPESI